MVWQPAEGGTAVSASEWSQGVEAAEAAVVAGEDGTVTGVRTDADGDTAGEDAVVTANVGAADAPESESEESSEEGSA